MKNFCQPACWRCDNAARPPDMARLALCCKHLYDEVRRIMTARPTQPIKRVDVA